LSEYLAAAGLERNGYSPYLPQVKRSRGARAGREESPLFPGYVFVRERGEDEELIPVQRISGVIGWVQFEGEVPTVPAEEIEDLAVRLEGLNQSGGEWRRYRAGEQVRVVTGTVESLAVVLEAPKSPGARVRVLLSFMNRQVPARVPWETLEPSREGWFGRGVSGRPRRTRGRGRWVNGYGPRAVASGSP
jgi:transcription antitermination factor NusG